jgi:hypothetical protein
MTRAPTHSAAADATMTISSNEVSSDREASSMPSSRGLLAMSVELNWAGISALESKNTAHAIKSFRAAYHAQEQLVRKRGRSRTESSLQHSELGRIRSVSDDLSEAFSSQTTRNCHNLCHRQRSSSINVDSLFVDLCDTHRYTQETLFLKPMRLPPLEDFPVLPEDTSVCCDEAETALAFVSTCHAFNMAIAHHIGGIEKQADGNTSEAASLDSSTSSTQTDGDNGDVGGDVRMPTEVTVHHCEDNANAYFHRAGRFYEVVMKQERSRSRRVRSTTKTAMHQSSQDEAQQGMEESSSSSSRSNWFTPTIVLACINNLADLQTRLGNPSLSKKCYLQLRSTVANLSLRQQNNNGISEDSLQFFWANAYRGLLSVQPAAAAAMTDTFPASLVMEGRASEKTTPNEDTRSLGIAETSNTTSSNGTSTTTTANSSAATA